MTTWQGREARGQAITECWGAGLVARLSAVHPLPTRSCSSSSFLSCFCAAFPNSPFPPLHLCLPLLMTAVNIY